MNFVFVVKVRCRPVDGWGRNLAERTDEGVRPDDRDVHFSVANPTDRADADVGDLLAGKKMSTDLFNALRRRLAVAELAAAIGAVLVVTLSFVAGMQMVEMRGQAERADFNVAQWIACCEETRGLKMDVERLQIDRARLLRQLQEVRQ